MEKLRNTLLFWYYGAFVGAVLAATLGFLCVTQQWLALEHGTTANTAIYSIIILYVIITTPLALKLFSTHTEKLKSTTNETEKLSRYARAAKLRLAIVTLGLVAALFFYYVLQEQSLLWLAGISAIALYFCKPTRDKIAADLTPNNTEKEPKN